MCKNFSRNEHWCASRFWCSPNWNTILVAHAWALTPTVSSSHPVPLELDTHFLIIRTKSASGVHSDSGPVTWSWEYLQRWMTSAVCKLLYRSVQQALPILCVYMLGIFSHTSTPSTNFGTFVMDNLWFRSKSKNSAIINEFRCYEAKIEESEKGQSAFCAGIPSQSSFRLITSKFIYFQLEARCS